jgi:hypothetical protein
MTGRGSLIDVIALWSGFAPWQVALMVGMLLIGGWSLVRGRR